MKDHRLIDERSLAFDRLVAAKLRENSDVLDQARANLVRWMPTVSPSAKPALCEWMSLLHGPLQDIFDILEGTGERATRLRQSSPFCGMLTNQERTRIIRDFQARESNAT